MDAIEFGNVHNSCADALAWRESLGPAATQADAYLVCPRADWLVWQLTREVSIWKSVRDLIRPVIAGMVDHAVERHCLHCGIEAVEGWAARFLSGEDRSEAGARGAREAAVVAAAWAARGATAAAVAAFAAAVAAFAAAWAAGEVACAAWAAAWAEWETEEWHAEWCSRIRAVVPEWLEED